MSTNLAWPAAAFGPLLLFLGAPVPAAPPQGGEIVQSGQIFTGVTPNKLHLKVPVTIDGFDGAGKDELVRVDVTLDVRMSGEYVIQPTPVPPNGIVESHSVTQLAIGGKALAQVALDFAPIPWVYPVQFPIAVLWAKDGLDAQSYADGGFLELFESKKGGPIQLDANIDLVNLVSPPGWAEHVSGIFLQWEVRYVFE